MPSFLQLHSCTRLQLVFNLPAWIITSPIPLTHGVMCVPLLRPLHSNPHPHKYYRASNDTCTLTCPHMHPSHIHTCTLTHPHMHPHVSIYEPLSGHIHTSTHAPLTHPHMHPSHIHTCTPHTSTHAPLTHPHMHPSHIHTCTPHTSTHAPLNGHIHTCTPHTSTHAPLNGHIHTCTPHTSTHAPLNGHIHTCTPHIHTCTPQWSHPDMHHIHMCTAFYPIKLRLSTSFKKSQTLSMHTHTTHPHFAVVQ